VRHFFEVGQGRASGVGAADHAAHAGADHHVDRNAQFLQHAQHADVGEAARTTAGKHQRDARPRGRQHGEI
jgi:hypothetical protein